MLILCKQNKRGDSDAAKVQKWIDGVITESS